MTICNNPTSLLAACKSAALLAFGVRLFPFSQRHIVANLVGIGRNGEAREAEVHLSWRPFTFFHCCGASWHACKMQLQNAASGSASSTMLMIQVMWTKARPRCSCCYPRAEHTCQINLGQCSLGSPARQAFIVAGNGCAMLQQHNNSNKCGSGFKTRRATANYTPMAACSGTARSSRGSQLHCWTQHMEPANQSRSAI